MAPRPARSLTPPRISRVHPRERLFRALDTARSSALVWVEAQPGAGKTVLVASWLRARRLRALWYTLDGGTDAASLFHALRLGLQSISRRRAPVPRFQPEHLPSIGAFAGRFFDAFERHRLLPCVVVLDDYQEVHADSILHEALAAGIGVAPAGMTLVVVSRSAPPAEFGPLLRAGKVRTIARHELLLKRSEARAVARLHAGRSVPDRVLDMAGGWAAGVVLRSLAAGADAEQRARQSLFDYLTTEFFDRTDRDTRQVLLRTCLLPTLTAATAARVADVPSAADVVARLGRSGSFIEAVPSSAPTWRLHALFRDFLEARARDVLGADGMADLARRSAAALLDAGDLDPAAELLVRFSAWDDLLRIVVERAPALAAAGRLESLRRWLDAVPDALAESIPWVAYWRGVARFLADPPGAVASVERALEAFIRARDAVGTWQSWATAVNLRVQAMDDFRPLERRLEELEELRTRLPFPSVGIEASVVGAALSAYSNVRPLDPRADAYEERGLELARPPHEPVARMAVGSQLVVRCAYWATDLDRAHVVLGALRPLATARSADPMHALMWQFGEANYHAHVGAGDRAVAAADRGLDIAGHTGIHVWDSILLSVRINGALAKEDFAAMDRDLDALAGASGEATLASCSYHYTAANVALRRGEWKEAAEQARAAAELADAAGHPAAHSAAITVWAAAVAKGGGQGPSLERAAAAVRENGYPIDEFGALLLRAAAALANGAEAEADPLVRQAFAVARRIGIRNSVYVSRADFAELCAFALERGIEPPLAIEMVSSRGLAPGPRARLVSAWPWTARVQTLGSFAIVRNGPSKKARKSARKELALLARLVIEGERGVSQRWLWEALWPDLDGDNANHALEVTLSRLRKRLGGLETVNAHGGVAKLDPSRVFVDAWAFEHLAARAAKHRARGELQDARRAAAQALELYRGDFLINEEDPSCEPVRNRLRERASWLTSFTDAAPRALGE